MKTVKQPRAMATRDKILGEAGHLFALKGYHDTKLAEVLKAAQERPLDAGALARYIVAIIEGLIMLTRTQQDGHMMTRNFDYLKEHLKLSLRL